MSKLVQQLTESQALDRYLTEVSAALDYQVDSGATVGSVDGPKMTTVLVAHLDDHLTVYADVFLNSKSEELELTIECQYNDGTKSWVKGIRSFTCPIAVENLTWKAHHDAGSIQTQLSRVLGAIYSIVSNTIAPHQWLEIYEAVRENEEKLKAKMPRQWPEKPPF